MRRILSFAFLLCSLNVFSQIEIPHSSIDCQQFTKNNFSYCIDKSTYETQWTAIQIKGKDIERKTYIPNDKEFFKDQPESISTIWSKIELQVQYWAIEFDSIYVVTGKTLINDSTNQYAWYKAVMKGCQGDGLGFWVTSLPSSGSIKDHSLTLNELEEKTGMDFFPTLDKDLQEIFESEFGWQFWPVSIE
jgi:DNA/RNA endonuclease G (NUC1)